MKKTLHTEIEDALEILSLEEALTKAGKSEPEKLYILKNAKEDMDYSENAIWKLKNAKASALPRLAVIAAYCDIPLECFFNLPDFPKWDRNI